MTTGRINQVSAGTAKLGRHKRAPRKPVSMPHSGAWQQPVVWPWPPQAAAPRQPHTAPHKTKSDTMAGTSCHRTSSKNQRMPTSRGMGLEGRHSALTNTRNTQPRDHTTGTTGAAQAPALHGTEVPRPPNHRWSTQRAPRHNAHDVHHGAAARGLRQAYDYWQDQPGFCKQCGGRGWCSRRFLACRGARGAVPSMLVGCRA